MGNREALKKGKSTSTLAVVCGLMLSGGAAIAGTAGGIYDMSTLLNEPHPFAIPITGSKKQSGNDVLRPQPSTYQTPPPSESVRSQRAAPSRNTVVPSNEKSVRKSGTGLSGILGEARIGVLVHDEGPFSRNKESGFDSNIEFLFISPDFLRPIWSPRPHVGATINSAGNTSQGYLGVTWEWDLWQDFFFDFSLGSVLHTGEKETLDPEKKSLGCSILFRESLDLGYRISGPHSVMFHFDHISNAKLCSTNEGLETFGIRYGYRF